MTETRQSAEHRALAAASVLWDPRPGAGASGVQLPLRERHPDTLSHCPRASRQRPSSAETITVLFGGDSPESLKEDQAGGNPCRLQAERQRV